MRKPEEIKQGLQYIAETNVTRKVDLIRAGIAYRFTEDLAADTLAYIQQLEAAQPSENHKEAGSEGCEWCRPSKDGDYAMSAFVNPNNPEQEAMLSVYGGQIVMEIKMDESSTKARMAVKINHCPMCGRTFGEDDRNGN